MAGNPMAWRIWLVAPEEWMLRGIYLGHLWKAPVLAAECLDTPRHLNRSTRAAPWGSTPSPTSSTPFWKQWY